MEELLRRRLPSGYLMADNGRSGRASSHSEERSELAIRGGRGGDLSSRNGVAATPARRRLDTMS